MVEVGKIVRSLGKGLQMFNWYSAHVKPNVEDVLRMNKYMTNVGGHYFKGDKYQHYQWSWSRKEMDELVAQKKDTRIMRYWKVVGYYCVWLGKEEGSINDMVRYLRKGE